MQSKPAKDRFIDLARETIGGDPAKGREDCQEGWHRLFATLLEPTDRVLDVGAGLGLSKERIPRCTTQDPSPAAWPCVDMKAQITDLWDGLYDYVTAFDVIEHVVEDVDFLRDMWRIARKGVFLTTPNETVSHAANGCHCREYRPPELLSLCGFVDYKVGKFWTGDGPGFSARVVGRSEFLFHTEPHMGVMLWKSV